MAPECPISDSTHTRMAKRGNIVFRIIPAFLALGLSLINIISVLTPAMTFWVKGEN